MQVHGTVALLKPFGDTAKLQLSTKPRTISIVCGLEGLGFGVWA